MTKTRFDYLQLGKIANEWSFFNEGSRVGPLYKTKLEALADLERYARESWGEK